MQSYDADSCRHCCWSAESCRLLPTASCSAKVAILKCNAGGSGSCSRYGSVGVGADEGAQPGHFISEELLCRRWSHPKQQQQQGLGGTTIASTAFGRAHIHGREESAARLAPRCTNEILHFQFFGIGFSYARVWSRRIRAAHTYTHFPFAHLQFLSPDCGKKKLPMETMESEKPSTWLLLLLLRVEFYFSEFDFVAFRWPAHPVPPLAPPPPGRDADPAPAPAPATATAFFPCQLHSSNAFLWHFLFFIFQGEA